MIRVSSPSAASLPSSRPAAASPAHQAEARAGHTSSVKAGLRWLTGASLAGSMALASAGAVAQPKLPPPGGPPKPAAAAPPAALPPLADKSADKTAKKDKAPTVEERAARGVVVLERNGHVLGLGTVLAGDGRILAALSPLGAGNDIDARFADNTVARVKLGHHDRKWDLAFLVPQSGKWAEGLTASARDPVGLTGVRSFTPQKGKAAPGAIVLRGKRSLLGGDDKVLENAIEIGSRVTATDLGAPLVDEDGKVIGVLARGCMPSEGARPCTPVAYGVPMSAIKTFLKTVPASAVAPSAWLGIQGVGETGVAKGIKVTVVHPGSPAAEAKLREGDRILAVAGDPVGTPDELADAIRAQAVGAKVALIVITGGKFKEVSVVLKAPPDKAAPRPAAELPALEGPKAPAQQGRVTPKGPSDLFDERD